MRTELATEDLSPIDRKAGSGEGGHVGAESHNKPVSLAILCDELKDLQVRRRHLIRSKDRNRLALGALVRRHLGWNPNLPEKEREKIRKQAAALIDSAIAGEIIEDNEWLTEFALDVEAARAPFDKRLAILEKQMTKIAEQLPAAEFVRSVKGFGMKTLGVIVGEAGNLSEYENPGKLWKRLGLAPKDTYAQAENGAHMVPRQRRAQIWACLGDPLLKQNDGIYRKAYDDKKAEYLAREWTKNHAHRAAHRYMEKLAIKDLWSAWRAMLWVKPLKSLPAN